MGDRGGREDMFTMNDNTIKAGEPYKQMSVPASLHRELDRLAKDIFHTGRRSNALHSTSAIPPSREVVIRAALAVAFMHKEQFVHQLMRLTDGIEE